MVSHLSNRYAREAWVPSVSIQVMQARKLEWKNKKQKQRQKKQQQQQKQQKNSPFSHSVPTYTEMLATQAMPG